MVYVCPNNSNLYEAGGRNSSKVDGGVAASMLHAKHVLHRTFDIAKPPSPKDRKENTEMHY